MATKIILPITEDDIRKEMCKCRLCDLSFITGIDESNLCVFRQGRAGLSGKNILKLINYLYYDN